MKNRIKEIRKRAKLTQAAFGEKLGISQNYVWMMESGDREPGDRTIRDICREFGVSEVWLRTGEGEMLTAQSREAELTSLVKRLMAARPESFRAALVTTLLRLDPEGPEWTALEHIYHDILEQTENREP